MEDKRKEGKTNWNGRGIGISEGGNECDKEQNIYSESQIIEYIARAHKIYFKIYDSGYASHWSAQKESCLDVRSFKGLNMTYENMSKYHCS